MDLSIVSTKELIDELIKRDGVKEIKIEPDSSYDIVEYAKKKIQHTRLYDADAARILVIRNGT